MRLAGPIGVRAQPCHPIGRRGLGSSVRKPEQMSRRRAVVEKVDVTPSPQILLWTFTRENCGPCKLMEQMLREVAKTFSPDEVLITALPVDIYPETAAVHHVSSLPTTIVMKNDEVRWRTSGFKKDKTKRDLMRAIRMVLQDTDLVFGLP